MEKKTTNKQYTGKSNTNNSQTKQNKQYTNKQKQINNTQTSTTNQQIHKQKQINNAQTNRNKQGTKTKKQTHKLTHCSNYVIRSAHVLICRLLKLLITKFHCYASFSMATLMYTHALMIITDASTFVNGNEKLVIT